MDLRIFINDYRSSYQLSLTSDMSTEDVIAEALQLADLPPDPMYTIFEVVTDYGIGARPHARTRRKPKSTRTHNVTAGKRRA